MHGPAQFVGECRIPNDEGRRTKDEWRKNDEWLKNDHAARGRAGLILVIRAVPVVLAGDHTRPACPFRRPAGRIRSQISRVPSLEPFRKSGVCGPRNGFSFFRHSSFAHSSFAHSSLALQRLAAKNATAMERMGRVHFKLAVTAGQILMFGNRTAQR